MQHAAAGHRMEKAPGCEDFLPHVWLAYVVTGMEGQPSGCSLYPNCWKVRLDQWEFQDPKMEVLYHIRPYFGGILPYISLT